MLCAIYAIIPLLIFALAYLRLIPVEIAAIPYYDTQYRKAGEARERARGEMPEGHAQAIQRFEQLQRQTAELLEMAQRMQRELERLKREMQPER